MKLINLLLSGAIIVCYVFLVFYSSAFFKSKSREIASTGKRIAAFIVDYTIIFMIFVVYFIVKFYTNEAYHQAFQHYFNSEVIEGGDHFYHSIALRFQWSLYSYWIYALLFGLFSQKGTFGHRTFSLMVRSEKENESYGFGKKVVRGIMRPVTMILWPLTFILSRLNTKRQWLHDKLVGVYIIDSEKAY